MPRILKLSPYYYPEQVSSTHLTTDLNEGLFRNGYTIENYVPTPSRGVSEETRRAYRHKKYEVLDDGHSVIHRFGMFAEKKSSLQRAVRYLLVNLIQLHKGAHASDIDVIYSSSTPPTQGFLCAKVKRRLSRRYGRPVPFVFNLQDIFPDSLVNAKMTQKGSALWKIGRKIEDYTYRNADKIITISDDFKANIMAKGVPEEKIVVVRNWINTDNVFPVERKDNILFDRFKLDRSKFYITYSGNIGHSQNMELLLDVAEMIRNELPDLRFVLIGEGVAKEEVAKSIRDRELDNVLMFPFQDYSEIAHVFSLGDAGMIISKPGIGGSSVPSKTWSIMAAERPILASFDKDSGLAAVIDEAKCGIVAEAGQTQALIEAIRRLYGDAEERLAMGKRGGGYIDAYLSKDKCVQAYVDTINSVLKR